MFSQRVNHHKNIPQIYQTATFLSFYNTRHNKINQIAAFRMDWYLLISIHKFASRAIQISKCLMNLDDVS